VTENHDVGGSIPLLGTTINQSLSHISRLLKNRQKMFGVAPGVTPFKAINRLVAGSNPCPARRVAHT
jgi:hypothetical protein